MRRVLIAKEVVIWISVSPDLRNAVKFRNLDRVLGLGFTIGSELQNVRSFCWGGGGVVGDF